MPELGTLSGTWFEGVEALESVAARFAGPPSAGLGSRCWDDPPHLSKAGVPPLLVVPKLWQRQARGKISGELQPCAWQVKLKHDDKDRAFFANRCARG